MYLPRSLISHLYTQLVRSYHPLSSPVLILSSLDPDAICACRIFAALLKRDYIPHKIQPVAGYEDLAKAGDTLVRPMKITEGGSGGVVICLGVGGLIDLSSMLGLDSDDPAESMAGVEVWLLDARRPWNLHNVFGGQPPPSALQEMDANARRKTPGVDKGCLQRSYKPGKGGIIVFDDGDINDELDAERDAYCALAEMPDFDEDIDEDDNDEGGQEENVEGSQESSSSKKRKSWSDRDDESIDGDDERPRQRRRSNSGSSIASPPPSSQPSSPPVVPKQPTAKQLRRKLIDLKKSHEAILDNYYAIGNSYSEPISSIAYSLASELGREDNDMLWLAIVGVTSLELSGYTSTGLGTSRPKAQLPTDYHKSWKATRSSRIYGLFRDEVRRLNAPALDENNMPRRVSGPSSPSDHSIQLSPDPRFLLLRHWSLYDSMLHSPYLASRLHVWKDDGIKRLHKLLAKMGVSLTQCKQTYTHMDMDLKKVLRERLLQYAGVYGLDDIVPSGQAFATYEQEGWGFVRSWGWKAQLSAIDVGVILGAILDVGTAGHALTNTVASISLPGSSQATNAPEDVADRSEVLVPRFFAAYDALAPSHPTQLLSAIPTAQHLLRAINRTGSSLLSKRQLRHLRAFRMSVLKEGPDLALFANSPGALTKLALWLGEAIEVSERDRKGIDEATPFVLAALDEPRGTYLIVGTGGGIGAAADHEAKKEKEAAKQKRRTEKEEARKTRRQDREKRREIRRAALGEDEEDEETESESEAESSDDDSDEETAKEEPKERGFGHNRFGIAFQEVVEETSARVKIDSFDHCVVEVQKEDLTGFLEGLSLKSVVGK
jgi:cell division control protein 45